MARAGAVVIGAGVIGLAVARALARAGHAPLILEANDRFGAETSSRNSGVIHAGLYYPAGSLKSRLCIAGSRRLYAFCAERGVPHRRLGKLVIAHEPGQIAELEALAAHAAGCGVTDLELLDAARARALEPALTCAAALHAPSTGIVDPYALMLALLGDAEANDAQLVVRATVAALSHVGGQWWVHLADSDAAVLHAPIVVNAAGLGAQALATMTGTLQHAHVPPLRCARGNYFAYSGPVPFRRLIYPLPESGGLGTHLTLDLAGQARFGPDVEWSDRSDPAVDPGCKPAFTAAARRIWPALDPERLHPAWAGVRPKLSGPGEPPADFVISGPADHGCAGLVNLFGIESPGLTASLAIADAVLHSLGI